jgi:hypothetical protein
MSDDGVQTDFGRGCYGVTSDQVLESIGTQYQSVSSEDTIGIDCAVMLAIAVVFKLVYFATFYRKSLKTTTIKPPAVQMGKLEGALGKVN